MKSVSKNILLISLLVLVNLAIFLFCKLLTDEGNFIWYKTDPSSKLLVSMAAIDLMRVKYFVYANSINFFLMGIYFAYDYKKRMGLLIAAFGIIIFFGGNKLFEENVVENYYTIFKNQNVPADFVLEPIKSAGKKIGPYLMEDINNKFSKTRKSAIMGLGEIKYAPSADALNIILHDLSETADIRGEAYLSLLKINSEASSSYARIFIASSHPIVDQEVMRYIEKRTNQVQ